ncbi:glycosyltransferase family 2 protein [Kytococcus sp. Marseille-QA3725]
MSTTTATADVRTDVTTAVLTLVHGRHAHLANQRRSLARSTVVPDLHVVVAMDDPAIRGLVDEHPVPGCTTVVTEVGAGADGLPLARARNLAADEAARHGADVLVLLDVDCIAEPGLVGTYARTLAAGDPPDGPGLWCGPTGRLRRTEPPAVYPVDDLAALRDLSDSAPGRPVPPPGEVVPEPDLTRFWSLNFAMTVAGYHAVGGFDEAYVGYGGGGTDFGQRLGATGGTMLWLGGAVAHHQWHESHSPPWDKVADVVRNGRVFADRWGWWPMTGWLEQFAERGLVRRDPGTGHWELVGD